MADEWGSPELEDPTARLERIFNSSLERLEHIRDNIMPAVVNRPPGSQKVSREDMLRDYGMIQGDLDGLRQRLEEMIEQYGQVEGRHQFEAWAQDMRKS